MYEVNINKMSINEEKKISIIAICKIYVTYIHKYVKNVIVDNTLSVKVKKCNDFSLIGYASSDTYIDLLV